VSFYSRFAERYEAIFPFRPAVLAFLTERLPPGRRRVLDLGCGTGHYCGRLAAAGHDVVGIDLDPQMVATAARAYPGARFAVGDLVEFRRLVSALDDRSRTPVPGAMGPGPAASSEAFDLIFCIGNVLPHVPQRRLPELLVSVRDALRPGGAWLLQTVNWDQVLGRRDAHFRFPDRVLSDGTRFSREYAGVSARSVRFRTRLTAPAGELFSGEVELHPLPARECRRHHVASGLVEEGHWADFAGTPFVANREGGSVFVWRRP
jgi:SAM-dependent methyltransferase